MFGNLNNATNFVLQLLIMKDEKDTSITFRTTGSLKKKLQAMADKESRTLSNMIELLLKKATEKK